jgi:hypothetical protein
MDWFLVVSQRASVRYLYPFHNYSYQGPRRIKFLISLQIQLVQCIFVKDSTTLWFVLHTEAWRTILSYFCANQNKAIANDMMKYPSGKISLMLQIDGQERDPTKF